MTPHASGLAYPGLVVAVHVGTHGELGRLLLRREELQDLLRVSDRVRAARDGPGDGTRLDSPPVNPYVHLRRGGDEILVLPEVHERPVGGRVAGTEPPEHLRRGGGAAREERLPGHHLEEVATPEEPMRSAHAVRVFARPVVRLARDRVRRPPWCLRAGAGQADRRPAVGREVEPVLLGRRRLVVHDQDGVGEVEHEIALGVGAVAGGRAGDPQPDGIELEREVVAERAVEAEVGIVLRFESGRDGAKSGEDGRLAAPVLFREALLRLANRKLDGVFPPFDACHVRLVGEGGFNRVEQHCASMVECACGAASPPRDDLDRRVGESEVPPGVASGVLV